LQDGEVALLADDGGLPTAPNGHPDPDDRAFGCREESEEANSPVHRLGVECLALRSIDFGHQPSRSLSIGISAMLLCSLTSTGSVR
jgi:hypothetical protein